MSATTPHPRYLITSTPANFSVRDEVGRVARADIVTAFDLHTQFTRFVIVVAGPAAASDAVEVVRPLAAVGVEFFVRDYHLQDRRDWNDLADATGATVVMGLPPEAYDEDDGFVDDAFQSEEEALSMWFDDGELSLAEAQAEAFRAATNFRETAEAITQFLVDREFESVVRLTADSVGS